MGDCAPIDVVKKGDLKPLTCTIIIPRSADPSSEPQFNVVLSGNSVTVNKSVSMLVASTKEVTWEIEGVAALQTGESSSIEVTITNTGNSLVSGALKATP